jgi:hypothetical protein
LGPDPKPFPDYPDVSAVLPRSPDIACFVG